MLLEFDNDVLTRNRQMALVMFGLAVELDLERFVMDPASIRGILMLSAKAEKRGREQGFKVNGGEIRGIHPQEVPAILAEMAQELVFFGKCQQVKAGLHRVQHRCRASAKIYGIRQRGMS